MSLESLQKLLETARAKSTGRQPTRNRTKTSAPKKRELSADARKNILETYQQEQNAFRTHKLSGHSEQAVWRVLYESGYTEADLGRSITAQTRRKVLDRHREGMGARCIAGRYRLQEQTVQKILHDSDC